MIVHEPELLEVAGRQRVQARIEARQPRLAGLGALWFEVDPQSGLEVGDRADAFAVAMLPIAMACGEPLEIRGRTSPRLAFGLRELARVYAAWWPRDMQRVELVWAKLEEPSASERGAGIATAFSGGVDSSYTLWSHTQEREPFEGFRISHALLINGFDIDVDLEDGRRFETLHGIYTPLLAALGVELVTVRTNLRAFRAAGVKQGRMLRTFGTALVAPALAVSRAFRRLYLPGARGWAQFGADGSTPATDPLLSTAGLETIHDGAAAASRFEKLAALRAWPAGLANLRVCSDPQWPSVDGERGVIDNCGACKKCVWVQTSLELQTGRKTFPGFPRPVSRANLRYYAGNSELRARENLHAAQANGRRDIARQIRIGIWQERLSHWLGPLRLRRRQRRERVARPPGSER